MPKYLSTAVRLVVTIGLFAALLSRLDTGRIINILSRSSPSLFALAVAALAATNLFIALRWHIIMGGRSPVGPSVLVRILFVGWFFNQVLPTGIGGDAVRAWRCKLCGMNLTAAIGSILLDRASGYAVIVMIYAASLPALLAIIQDPLQQRMLLLVLSGAMTGLAALFLIDRLPPAVLRLRSAAALANLSGEARRVFFDPRRAVPIFALAFATTLLTVLNAYLAGRCVNIDLSFTRWLVILPPVTLFQLLPVSLGGWGIREAALVVILGALGIPGEVALAGSLCVGLSQILVGVPGVLVWLYSWDVAPGIAPADGLAASSFPEPSPGNPKS